MMETNADIIITNQGLPTAIPSNQVIEIVEEQVFGANWTAELTKSL